jgi:hypothetical protein
VNSRKTLEEFCDFVWEVYSSDSAKENLSRRYQEFREIHPLGGISDMTFFTEFRKRYPDQIGDLSLVRQESVFDITLDTVLDYEKDSGTGYKKIVWKNNKPFASQLRLGKLIQFHTLHFQGRCKKEIQAYTTLSLVENAQRLGFLSLHYGKRLVKKIFA